MSVCVSTFLSVVVIIVFSDCRIYLFSSLAAKVFNKLTRYSLPCFQFCLVYSDVVPLNVVGLRVAEFRILLRRRTFRLRQSGEATKSAVLRK